MKKRFRQVARRKVVDRDQTLKRGARQDTATKQQILSTNSVFMRDFKHKKPVCAGGWSGNVLFSRGVAPQVSSGLKGLTAVFGMGTSVSPSL